MTTHGAVIGLLSRLLKVTAVTVLVTGLMACGGTNKSGFFSVVQPDLGPVDPVDPVDPDPKVVGPQLTRYDFNNSCVVLKSVSNGQFVALSNGQLGATATELGGAEAFYLKPSSLGNYLLFSRAKQLVSGAGLNSLSTAQDANIFSLRVVDDATEYPQPPLYDREPTATEVSRYRNFSDPLTAGDSYTFSQASSTQRLSLGDSGRVVLAAANNTAAQQFSMVKVTGCAEFPEAHDNTVGETFAGQTSDGSVLGMADVHVHLSASTFLGGAQHGSPFHKFGVTHALSDCSESHGQNGRLSMLDTLFSQNPNGHNTGGWPTHIDWPSRGSLTHEAMYWKWVERAWKSGLRILVNDVVENETLCELQRNITKQPLRDCNEMNNATNQIGTLYALQDYIDAQYGGRGKGFFRLVLSSDEARETIAQGKLAVVIGIEISNVLNCKIKYNPLRQQQPFEETGTGPTENSYTCDRNEVVAQLDRLTSLGVRQIITIHEFDNAFGGNGIFDGLVLNQGNRENSGGVPSEEINALAGGLGEPSALSPLGYFQSSETPTGEYWTTYDCPETGDPGFSGYLFGSKTGGTRMTSISPTAPFDVAGVSPLSAFGITDPLCPYLGQGFRPGGALACYPAKNQCNARWLTPMGVFAYQEMMKRGLIFDIDHLELEIKSQALALAEAQPVHYPFVSTHGNFGGTSNNQAERMLKNGGFIFPSLGNGAGYIREVNELRKVWEELPEPRPLFSMGFGTDTNGLSTQSPPPNVKGIVKYPFYLFDEEFFTRLGVMKSLNPEKVRFDQPEERDDLGNGRTWNVDEDGSAHYGMMSDFVREVELVGSSRDMLDLFNSAEGYLRTWKQTELAQAAIITEGIKSIPLGILRAAPVSSSPLGPLRSLEQLRNLKQPSP
jgi:hypothetical protein